jgi:hypothetical protein
METKNFNLITIEDVIIDIQDNPGITEPQINYSTAIGGSDAPAEGATKNTGALANLDAVDTDQIVAGAVSAAKTSIAAINPSTGEINANKVGTTQIDTNAVTEAKILASAITEAKIATSAVTEGKISALAVTAAKIAAGAITAEKISAGAVTASKITSYNFIMSAGSFSNNSPSAGRISWSSVKVVYNGTEYTISNSSCSATEKHIYWQLSNPTVFSSSVSLPALGNDDFLVAFNNSGAAIMVWNSTVINGNRITAGSISATQIAANSITANEIAATTITANEIAASTITAAKMNVSQLSAIAANLGSITSGTITGALIQTSSSNNTGIKISSSIGGMNVYGENINIYNTSGTQYGTIGSGGAYLDIASTSGRNIRISPYAGSVFFGLNSGSGIAPETSGQGNCGLSSQYWANVYTNNVTLSSTSGAYINFTSSRIRMNSDTQIIGTLYASGAIECSTARIKVGSYDFYPTTGAYDASKYYLRT